MNRGIPFDALAERLAQAREVLRRNREGDITAPHHHVELEALCRDVAEWLTQARTCGEQISARRAEEAEERCRTLQGQVRTLQEQAGAEEAREWRAEAPTRSDHPIPREDPPGEGAPRSVAPEKTRRRPTAAEATVPLNFGQAQSYSFDDKVRKIRFTVTVESVLD